MVYCTNQGGMIAEHKYGNQEGYIYSIKEEPRQYIVTISPHIERIVLTTITHHH